MPILDGVVIQEYYYTDAFMEGQNSVYSDI